MIHAHDQKPYSRYKNDRDHEFIENKTALCSLKQMKSFLIVKMCKKRNMFKS